MTTVDNALPSAPSPDSASGSPAPRAPADAQAPQSKPRRLTLLLGLAALLIVSWQWFDGRQRLSDLREEATKRLADVDATARQTRALAQQTQDSLLAAQARIALLEGRLNEIQGQEAALAALYQDLARGRDERTLAEVEQAVTIAAQQLQYAGNVAAALFALQGADNLLSHAANPRNLQLKNLLERDIERLKALSGEDTQALMLRLESLLDSIDSLPLAFEHRPPPTQTPTAAAAPAQTDFWRLLAQEIWHDLRQLVHVERIDEPDAGLLLPNQVFFLRENLRLRLTDARLALLNHDVKTWRSDLAAAQNWLQRYFDTRTKSVMSAQAAVETLIGARLLSQPPSLDETLRAVSGAREALAMRNGKR